MGGALRVDLNREGNMPVADLETFDQPTADHILRVICVSDAPQHLDNCLFVDVSHP